MKKRILFLYCITFSMLAISIYACTQKNNNKKEYIPGVVWNDSDGNPINAHGGGIMFHNGTYYWYGESKGDSTYRLDWVTTWECWRAEASGVSCYSSQDLVNWKFEGLVLPGTPDEPDSDLHPSQVIERPKVIYNEKTKKFVMWMHIESPDYEKAHAGVAISDSPTGNFTYLGSFKPNGQDSRDQTIFKDDDGRAYHIYSSEWNKTLYIGLLNNEYTQHTGIFTRNFIGLSREAPAVFKHEGKYYMISSGCTGWDPNVAECAVADSMLGEWTVIGNPCTGKDADSTFYAQSTFVLPIAGKKDTYIAMFDRWNKTNLIDSRYVWLPLTFENNMPVIEWKDKWEINIESSNAYYIGTNNGNLSDGSKQNPWKSFKDVKYSLLKAGDTIYLMNDCVFESLYINALVAGTKDNPIVITSYDSSKAKIVSGDKAGFHIRNSSNVRIERLHLTGSGRKNGNTKSGLHVEDCDNISIYDIETEGYQKSGLYIQTSSDIIVDGVDAHENGFAGIYVSGIYGKKNTAKNIIIRNCKAENNPGDPTNLTNHSGNGILVGSCSNVLIEYCTATNNGWDMPRKGNGPVGIWAYEADSVLIQYCIAYRNKTSEGSADGGGYDFDGGVTNSTIQYCLSYENEGAAFGLFQYAGASHWYNNTIRYCISENDGLVSAARAGVFVWNATGDPSQLKDCYFYNNTIYNKKGAAISYEPDSEHSNFYFYNNIFVSHDDLITGVYNNSTFRANNWYSLNNKGFKIRDINSLNTFPDFKNPGKTNITDPYKLSSYDAYTLPESSILRTCGLNLNEQFGIITGGKDFNQNNISLNGIGACR